MLEPYFDDMPVKLAAADMVVARAGSTTIAELVARAIPAILVPFPYATADHQTKNARALADVGAAILVPDADIDAPHFARTIATLAQDEALRADMRCAYETLSVGNAREALANLVENASA